MDYEFIPIVYPNKPDDTSIPASLPTTFATITTEVVAGQGLPFIESVPYVAPAPVPAPTPLPQTGVIVNTADTLVYHPLTDLPATTTFTQEGNYSLPPLITTMGGDQSLYAPFGGGSGGGKDWSMFPAVQTIDIASNRMENVGNMLFGAGSVISGVGEISLTAGGFGALTLNALGIQSAGDITGAHSIALDDQVLTALPNALLLNGTPIATISDLPNIYQWANYPALSNVVMNASGATGAPFEIVGTKRYGWADGGSMTSIQNLTSPANPTGNNKRLFMLDTPTDDVPKIIYSSDLSGSEACPGTYTGVPNWANFPAVNNVDWGGKEITNINKITFNTATPGLGGASINALNDMYFSYVTAGLGQAGITNVNNIAFWNPTFPGVPGFYNNIYTKRLTYRPTAATDTYLCTDTQMAIPSKLYMGGVAGFAGAEISVQQGNPDQAKYIYVNNTACPSSWSEFDATNNVEMVFHGFNNLAGATFSTAVGAPQNVLTLDADGNLTTRIIGSPARTLLASPLNADLNMANFGLTNLNRAVFNGDPNNILINNGTDLLWRGRIVLTGNFPDSVANWANYQAVNDVSIPPAYTLNINQANTLFFYKDAHLNTNIYHGVEGNLDSPDFISFPTTFQVGNLILPARVFSVTAGAEGLGLNSITEVNIDATLGIVINSAVLVEIGGAAVTINPVGATLITSTDVNINGTALVELASSVITLNAPIGDLNFNALTSLWDVGALSFNAGVVEVAWGGTTINTGASLWTASTWTYAGGNFNIGGLVTTINSGSLLINTTTATAINSPVLQLNSAQTIVAAGRVFETDILEPTTANSLAISGVDTITGRTDTGMVQTEVKSIAGHGSGMNLTNIANFETYSATNVLLPCKTFQTAIPTITLNFSSYGIIYGSSAKVWSWQNIPSLLFSFSVYGGITNSGSHASGDPAPLGLYIVLKNQTTTGNDIFLAPTIAPGVYEASYTTSTATGGTQSSFVISNNYTIVNDQSLIKQGDSYLILIFARNAQASPTTNAITLQNCTLSFNVHNAGAL